MTKLVTARAHVIAHITMKLSDGSAASILLALHDEAMHRLQSSLKHDWHYLRAAISDTSGGTVEFAADGVCCKSVWLSNDSNSIKHARTHTHTPRARAHTHTHTSRAHTHAQVWNCAASVQALPSLDRQLSLSRPNKSL